MSERKQHPLGSYCAILLAFFGLGVGITWPLATRLTGWLPDGTDTLLHYWNGWWVWRALRHGQSPYYTRYLFYPAGISLVYNNFAWLHILPWGALEPLVGGIAAYNLTFLVHLALCGFAAFLLIYELTGDRRAAFLAGLIYQCWPYRISQPSHPNLISTWGIPIFLLFLTRTIRQGRWRDGLATGLSLALVGYTRWQMLIPASMVGGIYLAFTLPGNMNWRRMQALLLAGALTIIALAPAVLLFAHEWRTSPADLIIESEEATMQTDLLAYLTPPGSHPVLGAFTRPVYARYYADRGSRAGLSPYIGATALFLLLVGVRRTCRRDSLPWVVVGLMLVALALGPTLRVNGQLYPAMPMPYNLAARLFVVRLMREPDRFNMFLALPFAVLSAYGIVHLLSQAQRRGGWAPVAMLCLVGGAILFEYLPLPFPLQSAQASEFYNQLAAEPGEFAVLDVPLDPYKSKPYMFAQVTHQRPILLGHSSRYPQGAFHYLEDQPWLYAMEQFSDIPPKQTDLSRQLAALASDGIRYLVVHKDLIGGAHWARWQRYLAIAPRFEDADIAAYATSPLAGRDFELASEIVPGLGFVRTITSATCLNPGQVMEVDVAWGTTASLNKNFDVRLALVSEVGMAPQEQVFPITRDWPSRQWPANTVAWGYYALHIPPTLPVGVYTVTLALVDHKTGVTEGRPATVEHVAVSPEPCAFAVPPGAVSVSALFGDAMRLLGYHLDQTGDSLALGLHWRSEHRMDVDYKVFVHVFDPATGTPVAQDDSMPLRWRYPTTFWGPAEVISDTITISLKEAPPGTYGVAVGAYNPMNMERLPVVNGAGQPQPDGRLVLQGEAVRIAEH